MGVPCQGQRHQQGRRILAFHKHEQNPRLQISRDDIWQCRIVKHQALRSQLRAAVSIWAEQIVQPVLQR
jgi:hypothetical protein